MYCIFSRCFLVNIKQQNVNLSKCPKYSDHVQHITNQKLVGASPLMITCGITLFIWSLYLAHCSGVRLSQKDRIPPTSSSLVLGLQMVLHCGPNILNRVKSGDDAGVFITESSIPFSLIHSFIDLLVCFESLSCKLFQNGISNFIHILGIKY